MSYLNRYREYRRQGYGCKDALRNGKIHATFDELESRGLVRLVFKPDFIPYDDSCIDTWTDISESARARARKELWEKIEQDGVTVLVGEYRVGTDCEFAWVCGDSICGLIGTDDCGYAPDIMAQTIDALKEAQERLCTSV